jgi:ABC-type uncharacterized transport system auxiliary subunit
MNWPTKKTILLLLTLLVSLCGCINLKQPYRKIDYYTLEYDPPKLSLSHPLALTLRIERFTVAPTYNSSHMVFRDKSFKRNTYVYHQWRANPADLVGHFLYRDIRQSGLCKAVLPYSSSFAASYVLDGSVDEFFEWDTNGQWKAVLSLGITLMAENEPDVSKQILFQQNYHAKENCQRKNPQALAEAMSRAMTKLSQKIMEDIYECLKTT